MKKLKAIILFLVSAFCVGCATACLETSYVSTDSSFSESTVESSVESSVEDSSSSVSESDSSISSPDDEKEFGEGYETITIAEALELCGEPDNITNEQYYIIATIDTVTNPIYGAMVIFDETGSIGVYNTESIDGTPYQDMEEKPYAGDKVLLSCTLQNYNGTKEVKQAYLVDFEEGKVEIDESDYTELTIAEAREVEDGTLVKVTGVVAQITYADGMIPNGVMLIDRTQSIYVFDGDLAGRVQEGNTVTILAEKDYWILEKEQAAAEKHGYKGCNQLTNVTLVSNDEGNTSFPIEWIEETTIKNIMDTPVTTDITSIVYKVNALVSKVDGSNFVNYYFNDIDGETGSYTYTQCSGSDFAWLDEFDGKICTVYLTMLNAKSTDSVCVYRFLPVAVEDEGYVFDKANTAKFVVEYYGVDQFAPVYTADPALLLNSNVSSSLLGFENATISYVSSDTDVVYFEKTEEGVVMRCGKVGEATVTIKGEYEGTVYTQEVKISVEKAVEYETITVAEAIATAVDTEGIIVKGIVGPSLINRNGFYLFGEDGSMIAVLVANTTDLVGLEIGHEVIIQGMRERFIKSDASTTAGQTCIVQAVLLVNNYGNHEYSTKKFVDFSAEEFYALDSTVDYSTTVYVLTAKINYVDKGFYTTINLTAGSTTISLYMSGAGQYSWMEDYYGQEVTLEIAPCNWNDKTYWAGCVLAIRNEDGSKVMNTWVFDNN